MNDLTAQVVVSVSDELADLITSLDVEFRERGDYKARHWYLHVWDLLVPSHADRFSMVRGRTVYLAPRVALEPGRKQGVIRHELTHVMQSLDTFCFSLQYALRGRRIDFEVEAYAQNLLDVFERSGRLSFRQVAIVAEGLAENYWLLTSG